MTKNDLPEQVCVKMIALLGARLADAVDLQTQMKQAHWNVKGPNFIGLHKLFDKVNGSVEDYVDEIAERIVQLGGVAEGTVRVSATRSSLPEYPGGDHVAAVSSVLAQFAAQARRDIVVALDKGDLVTADLLTKITGGVDKWVWLVEAHEQ